MTVSSVNSKNCAMININNCTVDTLTAKVGIPLGVAWQIVAYKRDRKQRQVIECLDELKNIPGMTDQHFEKLLRHCKTFGYSALSSRTKSRRNATKNETKELEKGARRKLKAKSISDTQNISKKVSHLITNIGLKKTDLSEGYCKKRKRSMFRKIKSGPKNTSDLPEGKARFVTKNRPRKKARVVKKEHIPEVNKNYNRRTRKGKVKSLILNPVSVSASQSGNKLFVTYIPGLPEALNFLNSQKPGESLVRECPPPFASSPQPGSSSRRASSPPRPLTPQRSSSPPRPLSPQRSSSPPRPRSPQRSSSPPRPLSPQRSSSHPRPLSPQRSSSPPRPLSPQRSSSPPRPLSPQRSSSPPRPLSPQRSFSPPRPLSPQRSSSPPRPLSPQRSSSPPRPLSPQRSSSPPRPLSPQRSSSPPRPLSPQRSSSPPRPLSPQRSSSPPRPLSPQRSSSPGPSPPLPASPPARSILKRASSPLCGSPESTKISRRESRSPALNRSKTPKRLKINSPRTHRYMVSELIKKPDKNDHVTQLSTRAVISEVEVGLPIKTCIDDRPEKGGEPHQIKGRSHRHHRLKKERRRHHSRMSKERRHHSRQRNKRRRKSSQSIARRKKRLLHSKQRNEKRRQSNLGNEKRPRRDRHQKTVRFKNNGQDESPNNSFIERDLGPEKNINKTDKRCPDNANQGPPITGWSCIIL